MLKVSWRSPSLSIGTTRIHYGWLIATMAAILQVTTNFVNQAFAVLLPIIEDTFTGRGGLCWPPPLCISGVCWR